MGIGRKILVSGLLMMVGILGITCISLWAKYHSYMNPEPGITEHYHSGDRGARSKVAVIRVVGTIMDGEGFVKQQIDKVRKDESVKGVVLRVHSPGGTVMASHYIYHHLKKLTEEREIPMVVSMGGVAASGGYYVSMAVGDEPDTIFAEPTTWTGSIGVIIPNYDLSGMLENWNIEDRSFTSGPYKQLGSPTKAMDDEDRAVLQALVDESFEDFKNIVLSGRPKLADDEESLKEATTGQIFTAKQAKGLGLIDRVGFVEDAVERVKELADMEDSRVRVVQYRRPASLFNSPFAGQQAHALNLGSLFDMATPQAYYLFTSFPGLMTNSAN